MFVIGVAGQAQMGKDTLADDLVVRLNHIAENASQLDLAATWRRSAFAYAVKKVFCDAFGVDMDFVEKWKVIPEPPPGFLKTVRQCLQIIGDGFRQMKETVWLDIAFRDRKPKIISDVRYVNEFKRIRLEGGLNILVARPDKINDDPNGSEAQIRPYIEFALKHFKEGPLKEQLFKLAAIEAMGGGVQVAPPEAMECFDYFIINNGTKEEFYAKIENVIVPYVQQFVFEFPEDKGLEEEQWLISA